MSEKLIVEIPDAVLHLLQRPHGVKIELSYVATDFTVATTLTELNWSATDAFVDPLFGIPAHNWKPSEIIIKITKVASVAG